MCGISGVFSTQPDTRFKTIIDDIVQSQYRRGPDAQAVETVSVASPQVVLGHNRLSIIDLSVASNQPLWDHEKRICIVFNGEIYNYLELRSELELKGHRFVTKGDSEVIVESFKAWGIEAVQRFIGMFAFALWDASRMELWLVRDRFGVKPLYFHHDKSVVLFASTTTAIAAAMKLSPDLDYVLDGIELKMYERDGANSPFIGLNALTPGSWLKISQQSNGGISFQLYRYYDLEAKVAARRAAMIEQRDSVWIEEVSSCLESSILLRLRSDVPVGVSLSGGIDSSTIAAITARRHRDVTAFTFGSPDDPFSEGVSVAAIATKAGIKVHYCRPNMPEIISATWATLAAQGAPFPTGSLVAQHFVFKEARQQGVIVLLGGQGADEALMGYHKFKIFLLQQAWREKKYGRVAALAGGVMALLAAELRNFSGYWQERHRFKQGKMHSTNLLSRNGSMAETHGLSRLNDVWQRQVLDVTRFSLPTLLRYEDRNSMGNSVESRLPFMDHRFIELGLALPDVVKVRHGLGKWVLREIARDLIPEDIRTTRKKRGFDVNHRAWISTGLGADVRRKLNSHHAGYRDFLARPVDIPKDFSDQRLIENPFAFAEAISLVWLSQCKYPIHSS